MGSVQKSDLNLRYSLERSELELENFIPDLFHGDKFKFCVGKNCAAITSRTVKTDIDKKLPDWRPTRGFAGLHIGPSYSRQIDRSKYPAHLGLRDRLQTGVVLRLMRPLAKYQPKPDKTATKITGFADFTARIYAGKDFLHDLQNQSQNQFFLLTDFGIEF